MWMLFTGKLRLRSALVASIVALMVPGLSSCNRSTHIDGEVKNGAGVPLKDVQITLTQGQLVKQGQSASDGRFGIEMINSSSSRIELKLTGLKDGYKPFEKTFSSTDQLRNIVITLEEDLEPSLSEIRRSATRGLSATDAVQLAELMCGQLPNSAAFPFKYQLSGDDVHDTLVLLGNFSLPCLMDRITDTTWMPDPRSEPLVGDFRAGDAAFFILCDSGVDFGGIAVPMLDKKQWETIGVYEYFDWVNRGNHRKLLQKAVRRWVAQHPLCCGSEADFAAGAQVEANFKISPDRLSELRHRLAGIKPGMNEPLVRQALSKPDLEIDLEILGGIISLNRSEKSAAVYFVERRSDAAKNQGLNRDFLRDRYVIVFFTKQGKFARVFSNAPQLPPMFPQNRKVWMRLSYGDEAAKN